MKQKQTILLVAFLCAFIFNPRAQTISASINTGEVTGKTEYLKKSMLYREFSLGLQYPLSKNVFFFFTVGTSRISYDRYDESLNAVFSKKMFLNSGAGVLKRTVLGRNEMIVLNIGIGCQAGFCVNSHDEIRFRQGGFETKSGAKGTHFAPFLMSGFDLKLNSRSMIGIDWRAQKDVYSKYKIERERLNMEKFTTGISYKYNTKR